MLDKRLNNTEPAPARRVLRFFALDKGRNNKESVTSKDLQPKDLRSENMSSPPGISSRLFSA